MKKLLNNIIIKTIIITLLPLGYSILFTLALNIEGWTGQKMNFIVISAVLLIVHLVALCIYGKIELEQKNYISNFDQNQVIKENSALISLMRKSNKIIKDNADKMYEHILEKKGHSEITDWTWMRAKGDEICGELYEFIKNIAFKGDKFSISIIFRIKQNNINGYTMMSRESYDTAYIPSSYRGFVSEDAANEHYYKEIFDKNILKPQVLYNKAEIEKKFKNIKADYSQFIALPIACINKTVGIIQIAAYEGSLISKEKRKIEKYCNDYFCIAINTMLLTDKCENIIQII